MKTHQNYSRFSLGKAAALLAVALLTAAIPARATLLFSGIDLGKAGRTQEWAALALGTGAAGGVSVSDTLIQNTVTGNIGAANGGKLTLSGTAKVVGKGYISTGGSLVRSGVATLTNTGGSGYFGEPSGPANTATLNNALMAQAYSDALAASTAAYNSGNTNDLGNLIPTGWGTYPSTINQATNLQLSDSMGGSHFVLQLSDFVLTGGAEFKLNGTATTTYVINVSNSFSINGGKVVLNGVLPENVLFNVLGSGTATISSNADLTGNGLGTGTGSAFILAPTRTLNISGGSKVTGTVIAGKVNISGASKLTKPTYTSL